MQDGAGFIELMVEQSNKKSEEKAQLLTKGVVMVTGHYSPTFGRSGSG